MSKLTLPTKSTTDHDKNRDKVSQSAKQPAKTAPAGLASGTDEFSRPLGSTLPRDIGARF